MTDVRLRDEEQGHQRHHQYRSNDRCEDAAWDGETQNTYGRTRRAVEENAHRRSPPLPWESRSCDMSSMGDPAFC